MCPIAPVSAGIGAKLAHDFGLCLNESTQLFISHVVKVAGLADFFLLSEQFQFAAQQFQGSVGSTCIWQMRFQLRYVR